MTISGTTNSITVNGNGLTTVFNYDFYMGGSSSYAVLVFTDTDGSETTITSSDFSITGVTDQDGGTFTYPLVGSPIAVSTSLRLSRILPLTQDVAIGNQGNFYPSAVERGLDYLTMIAQQQEGGAAGSLDAQSLFGNPQAVSAAGISVPIGSGLSFSGNTLVVSGISGSGTVTEVNTGTGLSGGPITGIGTVSMSTITTGCVLANFSGATAAPRGVLLTVSGGLTASSTTTSLTISQVFNGAMVYLTTDSTAVNATVSFTVSFGASRYDTNGYFTASADTRLTIPSGVTKVDAGASLRVSSISNDVMCLLLVQHLDSGNTVLEQFGNSNSVPSSNVFVSANRSGIPVTAGDYFIALLQVTTDTSVTIESELFQTALYVRKVE